MSPSCHSWLVAVLETVSSTALRLRGKSSLDCFWILVICMTSLLQCWAYKYEMSPFHMVLQIKENILHYTHQVVFLALTANLYLYSIYLTLVILAILSNNSKNLNLNTLFWLFPHFKSLTISFERIFNPFQHILSLSHQAFSTCPAIMLSSSFCMWSTGLIGVALRNMAEDYLEKQ